MSGQGDYRPPNYLGELIKLKNRIPPGSIISVTVLHDDWCAVFGGGVCDCSPEIIRNSQVSDPRDVPA